MIIFDLDSLADDRHRRHFIDRSHIYCNELGCSNKGRCLNCLRKLEKDQPDWAAYLTASDKDEPIKQTIEIIHSISACEMSFQIWSSRCESVRDKTIDWLIEHARIKYITSFDFDKHLKMRPDGDNTPQEHLFERWLLEQYYSGDGKCMLRWITHDKCCKKDLVEMVFSSHQPTIEMFRRRGIFTFDVGQRRGEF